MNFPVYRKYANNKNFFKIVDYKHFQEVKLTGNTAELHEFEAKILPDRNFIDDLIAMDNSFLLESTAEEFEQMLASVKWYLLRALALCRIDAWSCQ